MKKLLNKKGFTIVELITVVALLGVMLAILIPMLSTTDARKNEVREYARSFYSNVQELMVDEKIANNPLPEVVDGTAKYFLICAEVDENVTDYSGVKIYMSNATLKPIGNNPIMFNSPDLLADETNDDDKVVISSGMYKNYAEFATSLRKLLLGNERTGWYYAVVDTNYRVVSAYFVEGADSDFDAVKGGKTFSSDNVVNAGGTDQYAGAWPEELSERGKVVFQLPN